MWLNGVDDREPAPRPEHVAFEHAFERVAIDTRASTVAHLSF